jgi:hypothetical protein
MKAIYVNKLNSRSYNFLKLGETYEVEAVSFTGIGNISEDERYTLYCVDGYTIHEDEFNLMFKWLREINIDKVI